MSVRRKTFIVMAVIAALVFLAVYALSRIILEPGSNANEVLRIADNNLRVRSAFDREIAELDRQVKDYASWDDTDRFIQDLNPAYARSNLIETTQIDNKFDVMIYADLTGRILVSRAYDRARRAERPVPKGLLERLAPGSPLLLRENAASGRAGLLVLPEGAFLVSAHPVLTSRDAGPARGTILFARAFDAAAVSELGDVTHLPLKTVPLGDPDVPRESPPRAGPGWNMSASAERISSADSSSSGTSKTTPPSS